MVHTDTCSQPQKLQYFSIKHDGNSFPSIYTHFFKMRRFIFSFCLFLLLCSMLLSNVAKYFIMNSMQKAWCYLWFCVLYIFFFLNTELSLLFQNNSLGHNIFYDMSMTLFYICVHKNTLYTCMKSHTTKSQYKGN